MTIDSRDISSQVPVAGGGGEGRPSGSRQCSFPRATSPASSPPARRLPRRASTQDMARAGHLDVKREQGGYQEPSESPGVAAAVAAAADPNSEVFGGDRPLKEEDTSDSDDGLDDFEESGPVHALSFEGKLPSGTMFVSLARQRGTINGYVCKVSERGWFSEYKHPTISALERRLKQNSRQML